MILTCLALCKPLIPLALLFKQVPRLALAYCIFPCPPTQLEALSLLIAMPVLCPASFYFIFVIGDFILFYFSSLFFLLDCYITLLINCHHYKKKLVRNTHQLNPRCLYILLC